MSKELREAIRKHRTWSESVVLGTTLKHKKSNLVTDDELLALFDRYAEQREKQARIDELDSLVFKELDVSDVERFEYQNDGMPMLVIEPTDINKRLSALKETTK